jgi:hypothetical protein
MDTSFPRNCIVFLIHFHKDVPVIGPADAANPIPIQVMHVSPLSLNAKAHQEQILSVIRCTYSSSLGWAYFRPWIIKPLLKKRINKVGQEKVETIKGVKHVHADRD